jgi:replicative DNA helicase
MKILPNNIEAEQSILGSCLIDSNSVLQAIETLVAEDFYREDNKIIFECIASLFARSKPIDIITLKEELSSIGKLEAVGGLEYIAELPEKIITTANVENYISIVKEKAITRNLINMANEIAKLGFDSTISTEQLTEIAERKVFEITQKKNTKVASKLKDLLVSCIDNLEDIAKNGKKKGIPTGFIDLDKRIGGLKKTELIILAARPAMGKSAFVLNIATHVAINEKVPVLIFNLEMGKEQLVDRIICSECFINATNYRDGDLVDDDWVKLANGLSPLSDANIFIDDTSSITISEIKAKCRKMKMEENIGLVIIDYLQLITPSNGKGSREQEVAEISRSLKILAKELKIPVIALSQLSRANEKRNGSESKRPVLSDLRDSGSIEQDADIVMFIHREDYYNKDVVEPEKKNIAEIIVAKNRSGETGTDNLLWLGEYTKFANISKRDNY